VVIDRLFYLLLTISHKTVNYNHIDNSILKKKDLNMKLHSIMIFAVILTLNLSSCNNSKDQDSSQNTSMNDSVNTALLIKHLRNNFDDIHDVSMRFHHLDHRLNGVIQINMHWENGQMTSSSVVSNETNNKEFANSLIKSIEKWYIKELTGPFNITLPFRIKIVGSDDSTFFEKGILTGEIYDSNGNPIKDAKLHFHSSSSSNDTLRNCYSNREGIFVRTLIPVGSWDVACTAPGYEKVLIKNISFKSGDHIRKKITLLQK
jgi:hypothetical protein